MVKNGRNNIDYPKRFIKNMKKKKRKKIRNIPINKKIIEQKYNDAGRIL